MATLISGPQKSVSKGFLCFSCIVWSSRCSQLNGRVLKLSQELKEEQEMNRCLRANQTLLQAQLADEERKAKESGEMPR